MVRSVNRVEARYQPLPREFRPALRYRIDRRGRMHDHEILDQDLWEKPNIVYVRVLDDREVLYVGKADSVLGKRLKAHTSGVFGKEPAQQIARDYKEHVKGHTVTIYAYAPDPIRMCDDSLVVYPHAGLESAMIVKYKPRFVLRR